MDRTTLHAFALARFGLYGITFLTSAVGSRPLPPDRLALLAGVLLLLCGIGAAPTFPRRSVRLGIARIAVELALTFATSLLGSPFITWLLYFVVVAEAFLAFPLRVAFGIASAAYALVGAAMLWWIGPLHPREFLETMLSTFTGFVFVGATSRMAANQWRARRELEALTTQLREANERLRAYAQEVEVLSAARERERLAHAVHDSVAHALTGILMGLQAARRLLTRDPQAASQRLAALEEAARQGLEEVRRAVRNLRPMSLDRKEGIKALEHLVAEFAERTGLEVAFHADGGSHLPEPVATLVYNALQEALANAARHGRASRVDVVVRAEDGRVKLTVRDDGAGAFAVTPGMGLEGMRRRAEAAGGSLRWHTAPAEGFELVLTLPLPEPVVTHG
jgi:signal transduction histidine kinase